MSVISIQRASRQRFTFGLGFTAENTIQVVTKNMLSISSSLKSSDRAQNDRKPYSELQHDRAQNDFDYSKT